MVESVRLINKQNSTFFVDESEIDQFEQFTFFFGLLTTFGSDFVQAYKTHETYKTNNLSGLSERTQKKRKGMRMRMTR